MRVLRPTSSTRSAPSCCITTTDASHARRRDVSAATYTLAVSRGAGVESSRQRRFGQQARRVSAPLRRGDLLRAHPCRRHVPRATKQDVRCGFERALQHGANFGREPSTDHDHAIGVHPRGELPRQVPRFGILRRYVARSRSPQMPVHDRSPGRADRATRVGQVRRWRRQGRGRSGGDRSGRPRDRWATGPSRIPGRTLSSPSTSSSHHRA